jgi:SAM-dependent methyltransferase
VHNPIDQALAAIILASQHTPLRGRGGYSNLPREQQATARPIDKARAEARDFRRFFGFFPACDPAAELASKDVLDFGSGYGGRTVEYARHYRARRVCGTEPYEDHLSAGRELASESGVGNVSFDLCTQNSIPYANASFDVVTTFDVLEHVADPRVSMAELYRVLRPGGKLFAVFPLYRGIFAHHLDYITLMPALHLIFAPDRIMRVVTELLDTRFSHLGATRHPTAWTNYRGKRVMPMLNGMGLREFKEAARDFDIIWLRQNSIADVYMGRLGFSMRPIMSMPAFISELFTFNVACVMRKPS